MYPQHTEADGAAHWLLLGWQSHDMTQYLISFDDGAMTGPVTNGR